MQSVQLKLYTIYRLSQCLKPGTNWGLGIRVRILLILLPAAGRSFSPSFARPPLVVLSNNDGCAIARCAQAKALGIHMGQPAHELKDYISRFGLKMRSANFTLYGDMSDRVVSILRTFTPRLEVYSIDESFLDLSGVSNRLELAQDIRYTVNQWTGIPCCVGIGLTKTLAKMANKWAKKHGGVIDVSNHGLRAEIMD